MALLSMLLGTVACGERATPTAEPAASPTPTERVPQPTVTREPIAEPTATTEPTAEATTTPEPAATETPDGEKGPATVELEPFASEELGLSGVVPAGWSQVQPGIFARGNPAVDMAVLQVAVEKPTIAKELLAAIAKGYGSDDTPESTGERQANDLTWSFYAFKAQGVPRDLALAESKAGTLVVLLRSASDERDVLYEAAFLPVVDALVPLE